MYNLDDYIRKIPNFPKEGICFYDITSLWKEPKVLSYCIHEIVKAHKKDGLVAVAGIEARGFVFASLVAMQMGLPFIPVRKKGKLPGAVVSKEFSLEYGVDSIEVHKNDIPKGKVLIVDDLIATGGTIRAAIDLFRQEGAIVNDVACVIGLPYLNYQNHFLDVRIQTLLEYFNE